MTLDAMKELYAYDRWATTRVIEILDRLTNEEYTRDLRSSHGGIHGTFVHLLAGDRVWLDRWVGADKAEFPRAEDFDSLTSVIQAVQVVHDRTSAFLATLTGAKLQDRFFYKDSRGKSYSEILWWSMLHKVTHATYHRGQIVSLVRQSGKPAVGTDLVVWRRILTGEGES